MNETRPAIDIDCLQEAESLFRLKLRDTPDDLACRIVAGSTLCGGTVVNYTTSFATPPAVLA